MEKQLNVLSVNFDDKDTKVMQQEFNGENILLLIDSTNDKNEVIEKFYRFLPDVIVINMVDDAEEGMSIIRKIRDVTDDKYPPFFIAALYADETDVIKGKYTGEISQIGMFLHRYGEEHDIIDVVELSNELAGYIKSKEDREKKDIVWKCEQN